MACETVIFQGKEYNRDQFKKILAAGQVELPFGSNPTAQQQVERAIDKFNLVAIKAGANKAYHTKTGKASLTLKDNMNEWFAKHDGYPDIYAVYDNTHKAILFVNKNTKKLANTADDINGGSSTFRKMPFKFSIDKIASGEKTITVRPLQYNIGTYRTDNGKLVNVIPQGNMLLKDYLESKNITKKDFVKKFLGKEEVKYPHMESFLNNETPMFIYSVESVNSVDDIIPEISDPRFAKVYDNRRRILGKLKNQLKLAKGEERETLKDRIRRIEEQVGALRNDESRNISAILNFMENDMNMVEKILDGSPDRKSLEYANSLIYNYVDLLNTDFRDVVNALDEQSKLGIFAFIQRSTELAERTKQQFLTIPADIVRRMTGKDVLLNGLPVHTRDITGFSRHVLDSTDNLNPIVQTLSKVIKDAIKRFNIRFNQFLVTHNKVVTSLKKFQTANGLKGEGIYEFMIQKDEKGNKTGNFVYKFSDAYVKARREAKDPSSRILFYAQNHKFTINNKAWDAREKSLIEWFKNNREDDAILEEIDTLSGKTYEDKLNEQAQKFADTRNPYVMKAIFDRIAKNPNNITKQDIKFFSGFEQYGGFYTEKVGEEYLHPLSYEANEEWIDKKWSTIDSMQDSDPRKQFYDHFVDSVSKGRRTLQDEEYYLDWNYIPEKSKDLGFGGSMRNWAVNNVAQVISVNSAKVDPITGEIEKNIPVYMLNNTMSPENKSYDLAKVLENFNKEVINHEEKSDIEDDTSLLSLLLKEQKVYETNPDGSPRIIDGSIRYKQGQSNNFLQAQYRVLANLYDERQSKEGITNVKLDSAEVKQRKDEIKKEVAELPLNPEQLKEAQDLAIIGAPYLGDNENIAKFVKLAKEYNDLNGKGKNITASKIVNSLISFTSHKMLGLNLFAGFAEMLQGMTSLFTESASGRFFTDKEGMRAFGKVMKVLGPKTKESEKIKNIARYFGTHGGGFIDTGKAGVVSKVAYFQWELANTAINNTFCIAMLDHEKIKDTNGKEHSLYDVMNVDENGKFTVNNGFENPFYDDKGEYSDYLFGLMHKFTQVLKNNRDRNVFEDPIELEKSLLGRTIGQFKKNWMIRAYYSRFGTYKEADLFSGLDSKGFYRSFGELFKLPTTKDEFGNEVKDRSISGYLSSTKRALASFIHYSTLGRLLGAKPMDGISDLDAGNLKKFMREFGFIMTVTMILLCLTGGDDKDKDPSRKYFINQLVRLQRDLTTYMSPTSFASLLKNPAPMTSTAADFFNLTGSIIQSTVLMDPYTAKGQLRVSRSLTRSLPFVNQIEKLNNKFKKTVQYSSY